MLMLYYAMPLMLMPLLRFDVYFFAISIYFSF